MKARPESSGAAIGQGIPTWQVRQKPVRSERLLVVRGGAERLFRNGCCRPTLVPVLWQRPHSKRRRICCCGNVRVRRFAIDTALSTREAVPDAWASSPDLTIAQWRNQADAGAVQSACRGSLKWESWSKPLKQVNLHTMDLLESPGFDFLA